MNVKIPFLLPFLLLSLLGANTMVAQQPSQMTVKGRITDLETQAAIPFATISAPEVSRGTSADENGEYTLVLPANAKSIRITALGYIEKTVKISKKDNQELNVALEQSDNVLQEVTVKPKKYSNKTIRPLNSSNWWWNTATATGSKNSLFIAKNSTKKSSWASAKCPTS